MKSYELPELGYDCKHHKSCVDGANLRGRLIVEQVYDQHADNSQSGTPLLLTIDAWEQARNLVSSFR